MVNVFLPPSCAILLYVIKLVSSNRSYLKPGGKKKSLCLHFWFISYCKHHLLYCNLLRKVGRLNAFCDIVNLIFPLIGKKIWYQRFFLLPLIFSRMPWWSNDWLTCGISSKVFSQHAVLREMPFSVNKSKKPQPLKTVIIPWDTQQPPVKRSLLCVFGWVVFSYMAQKHIFAPSTT